MPEIPAMRNPSGPCVSVTKPRSSPQARIAFNAALSRLVRLPDYSHIIINDDPEDRNFTFIPCKMAVSPAGKATHKLLLDGGTPAIRKKTPGRVINPRKRAVPMLPPGKYIPTITKGRFFITYSPSSPDLD